MTATVLNSTTRFSFSSKCCHSREWHPSRRPHGSGFCLWLPGDDDRSRIHRNRYADLLQLQNRQQDGRTNQFATRLLPSRHRYPWKVLRQHSKAFPLRSRSTSFTAFILSFWPPSFPSLCTLSSPHPSPRRVSIQRRLRRGPRHQQGHHGQVSRPKPRDLTAEKKRKITRRELS